MTQNPILKVLFTLNRYKVKYLLIGGQACIIYGAAEFSRDSDIAILCTPQNIEKLKEALRALKAKNIYVPPLEIKYLKKGHACHFRCESEGVKGLRIDVIYKLRGCDEFKELWKRREIILFEGKVINVINLADLVKSKKTQRDKDWLMLKRLVDNDILLNWNNPAREKIKWWFYECRDSNYLIKLSKRFPSFAKDCSRERKLLKFAIKKDKKSLDRALKIEEDIEHKKDKDYWQPLRKELEILRREKNKII